MPDSSLARWRLRLDFLACLCFGMGPLIWPGLAIAGDDAPSILFAPLPVASPSTGQASPTSTALPRPPSADQDILSSAFGPLDDEPEIRYNGTPLPGSRVTVALNESDDPGATYRWTQIEGPQVDIDDPSKPRITFTIPRGAERLRFLLSMTDRGGERSVRVTIPIGPEAPVESAIPKADAGDDQSSPAGRAVLLTGARSSTPATKAGSYRWIQVAGPKVEPTFPDKQSMAFTPTSPGVYRFLLVVSANDVISEPDEVSVTVRGPASSADTPRRPAAPSAGVTPASTVPPAPPIKPIAEQVADVFDAVADRAGLFSSFDTVTSEMTRRLDAIVPRDPATRQQWSRKVFVPFSQRTATEMSALGLDLKAPLAHQQPMTDLQKERLGKLFQAYAQELRSASRSR